MTHITRLARATLLPALFLMASIPLAMAQHIRGTPGAPDALMTPNPFSLPAPTPPFTGAILPNAGDSQTAWLRERGQCGGNVSCIAQSYRVRTQRLEAVFQTIVRQGPF